MSMKEKMSLDVLSIVVVVVVVDFIFQQVVPSAHNIFINIWG